MNLKGLGRKQLWPRRSATKQPGENTCLEFCKCICATTPPKQEFSSTHKTTLFRHFPTHWAKPRKTSDRRSGVPTQIKTERWSDVSQDSCGWRFPLWNQDQQNIKIWNVHFLLLSLAKSYKGNSLNQLSKGGLFTSTLTSAIKQSPAVESTGNYNSQYFCRNLWNSELTTLYARAWNWSYP